MTSLVSCSTLPLTPLLRHASLSALSISTWAAPSPPSKGSKKARVAKFKRRAVEDSSDFFGFDGQAELYRQYRPVYPLSLLQTLSWRLDDSQNPRQIALDIGCGSGQLTTMLARKLAKESQKMSSQPGDTVNTYGLGFESVIGIDSSAQQLKNAPTDGLTNIEYRLDNCSGEKLSFDDNSIDLITFAQSLHWFDRSKIMDECHRVLKPGGLFAVMGYATPVFLHYPTFHDAFKIYYEETLGSIHPPNSPKCCWQIDRRILDHIFRQWEFCPPFDEATFDRSVYYELHYMTERELFGYFQTWSGYRTYCKRNQIEMGTFADPLTQLQTVWRDEMENHLGQKMAVTFPFFLLAMQKHAL